MARPPKTRLTMRALRPVVAGLEALGHSTTSLLAELHIQPKTLSNLDTPLPDGAMAKFWERAVQSTGDELLGMHVALAAPVSSFDVHGYALLSSATLRAAYQRACRDRKSTRLNSSHLGISFAVFC